MTIPVARWSTTTVVRMMVLSLFFLWGPQCLVTQTSAFTAQQPAIVSRRSRTATSRLHVSIGLGPDETDDAATKVLEEGVDYTVPNHEEHRLDRRSALDVECDNWFAHLLWNGGNEEDADNIGCLGPLAHAARTALLQPVELTNPQELPYEDDDWTPYVSTKLPWSVLHPAYGLERFGLPVPRRNAETWRHFDVTGMVQTPIAPMEVNVDEALPSSMDKIRTQLVRAGAWMEDEECAARLIYVNGVYCPKLSMESETARNIESVEGLDETVTEFMQRLPDGWTDKLQCPVPSDNDDNLEDLSTLSGPNHNVGDASSQFAVNTQQGTACFAALNTIRCPNVALVHEQRVPEADSSSTKASAKPIFIVHALHDAGTALHPRTVIVGDAGTCINVVQQSVSLTPETKPLFSNGYTQVLLHDRANITHSLLQESGGFPVSGVEQDDDTVRQEEADRPALQNTVMETLDVHCAGVDSHYTGTALSMAGHGRVRLATSVSLLQPEASCTLSGFSLTGGTCRNDIKTNIHHIADGCSSSQLQKNMVAGRSTSSFRGRIRVEQSAQQTASEQLSRTVLLTDRARAWSVPSLEIIADDVVCTHGATVSDLSEEELFYLRSRGLSVAAARNLLMYAFCNDVVTHVPPLVLGSLEGVDRVEPKDTDGDDDDVPVGKLQTRILRRLENLVPTGERAVRGEFQSI